MGRHFAVRSFLWVSPFLLLAGLWGCHRGTAPHKEGAPAGPSKMALHRNVELTVAKQQALVYRVETVGVLEAEGQTDIAAGVTGVVDQVLFREGDEVLPGTLLATVDQPRFLAEEQIAKANADRSKSAMELARDVSDRAERTGASVSQEERAKLRFQLGVAEAEHRSTLANHSLAKIRLDRSRVRAPYAGRINKRMVTVGSYLEEKTTIATLADLSHIRLAGYVPESAAPVLRDMLRHQNHRLGAAGAGLVLAGLTSPYGYDLWTNLELIQNGLVLSGFDPEFELLALPGHTFHGRIFYMSTVANIDTHMFEAKAEVLGWSLFTQDKEKLIDAAVSLTAKDNLPAPKLPSPTGPEATHRLKKALERQVNMQFWPGFTARIRFPMRSNPKACIIPEEAVRASEQGFIAFVPVQQTTKDNKTEWIVRARRLELGFRADGWVEVLQGLAPGEPLVRRGAEALEDGTPIRFEAAAK
jgi:RND family efflux transporter MFP subunit